MFNINDLGNIPIKKFDILGNLVELEAGDLISNTKYLLKFIGESFVLLNQLTSHKVLEKIKTVDGS